MEHGVDGVLLYFGGVAVLGLIAVIHTLRMRQQARDSRERLRRIRRILNSAR